MTKNVVVLVDLPTRRGLPFTGPGVPPVVEDWIEGDKAPLASSPGTGSEETPHVVRTRVQPHTTEPGRYNYPPN